MSNKVFSGLQMIVLAVLALSLVGCQGVSWNVNLGNGQSLSSASRAGTQTYTVKAGDCLSCIAAEFGVSQQALIDANKDKYPSIAHPSQQNRIQAGWVLTIPPGGQAVAVKPQSASPVGQGGAATSVSGAPDNSQTPVTSAAKDGQGGYYDDSAAQQIIDLTNAKRAKAGLSPFTVDQGLTDIARKRAQEIVTVYNHDGLNAYCTNCGENIYKWCGSPEKCVAGWMASPGHRANILDSRGGPIGVGYYVKDGLVYVVQDFGP